MATEKVYLWSKDLSGQATITSIADGERKVVRLSQTLFHPQGGGQRADRGTIGGATVVDVRHAPDGEVDHMVASLDGLNVGETVTIHVDAARRGLHARLHSAGHLIADAGAIVAPQLTAKAGHHWPGEARVEFEGSVADVAAFTAALSAKLNELVEGDLPLSVVGDPRTSRAVQICGEPVPCGGTHVERLGEIGPISIRKVQQKGPMLRVGYGIDGEAG